MSSFSEIMTTKMGRRYFVLFNEKYGDTMYIELLADDEMKLFDVGIGLKFFSIKKRIAFLFKNGRVKYIRDKSEQGEFINVVEIPRPIFEPIKSAQTLAERMDDKGGPWYAQIFRR